MNAALAAEAQAASTPSPDVAPILRAAGVPPLYITRAFETFKEVPGAAKALRAALAVAAEPRGLFLTGGVGSGKTHLAIAIIRRRAERWQARYPSEIAERPDGRIARRPPFTDVFVTVPEFLDNLRLWIARPDGPDPLSPLRKADLLVLDDLGRERVTDWAAERLFVLVDHRYVHQLPTIVTTNMLPDELASRGYDAVMSRIAEGGQLVSMTASDRRLVRLEGPS